MNKNIEILKDRIRNLEILLDRCRDHVNESMELMFDYEDSEDDMSIAQELVQDIDNALYSQGIKE